MDKYTAQINDLLELEELTEIGVGSPRSEHYAALSELDHAALFGTVPVGDKDMADCCHSALWLANHFLDESHQISQRIHTPSGSWLHGIMHRREGDFSNAKYWFRCAGDHPAQQILREACDRELSDADDRSCWDSGDWDPFAFVDLCQTAQSAGPRRVLCGEIARLEWLTLFDYCYGSAV